MTAEVAVALPAVILVLAACLGALGLASAQVRAQDTAADVARLLGRGETLAVAEQLVARSLSGARLAISRPDDLVCARIVVERPVVLVPVPVSASSCALAGGR